MFRRLIRWLCKPKLSGYQRLCQYLLLAYHRPRGDGFTQPTTECAVPPDLFKVAESCAEDQQDTVFDESGWPVSQPTLSTRMPNGHINFMGTEIFPDPTVTEFTARKKNSSRQHGSFPVLTPTHPTLKL